MQPEKTPQNSTFATKEIEYGDSTNYLAILDLEWSHVTSKHIYKCIQPLLNKKTDLERVCIYITKSGKEELCYEEKNGPRIQKQDLEENDAIREYLIAKRRYYMAILVFRTIEEAENIYMNMDGVEIEGTGNYIDFRFVTMDYIERNMDSIVCETDFLGDDVDIKINPIKNGDLLDSDLECDWEDERKREAFMEELFEREDFDSDMVNELIDLSESDEGKNKVIDENILKKMGKKNTKKKESKKTDKYKDNNKRDKYKDNNKSDEYKDNKKSDKYKDNNKSDKYKDSNKSDKYKDNNKSDKHKDNKKSDKHKDNKKSDNKNKEGRAIKTSKEKLKDFIENNDEVNFKIDLKDLRFSKVLDDDDFNIDVTNKLYKSKSGLKDIIKEKRKRYKCDD